MGVIRVQASGQSIVNYAATGIAAASTLWIYPLSNETLQMYGLAQVLMGIALLVLPFATAGTISIGVKFFPVLLQKGKDKSYLFNLLVLCLGTSGLFMLIASLIDRPILAGLKMLGFDRMLIVDQKFAIAALIWLLLYNRLLTLHASNYHRTKVPALFQNLVPKLMLPVFILGLYFKVIETHEFARYWVLSFLVPAFLHTIYLIRIHAFDIRPELTFFKRKLFGKILSYSGHIGLSTVASTIITRVDVVMVGALVGVKEAAIYSIALFTSHILYIPAESVLNISSPVIAKAFEEKNYRRIHDIYRKSAVNLFLIGTILYFAILGSLDAIFHFSPRYESIASATGIFAFLGLAKLIDMAAGTTQQIIMYSPKYRILAPLMIFLAMINVLLNYFLIREFGTVGAAIATLISFTLFSALKVVFIQRNLAMLPTHKMTLRLIILSILLCGYYFLMPTMLNPFLHIIVYCSGFALICLAGISLLRIETELTLFAVHKLRSLIPQLFDKNSRRS